MLIGISGFARSGKDTVCEILQHHGIIGERYGFANPIKDMVNEMFAWGDRHAFGDLKETELVVSINRDAFLKSVKDYRLDQFGRSASEIYEKFMQVIGWGDELGRMRVAPFQGIISPRRAYQLFGTEVGRDFIDIDLWLKISPQANIVVPDVRFPNEADWILANGGTMIRVQRQDIPDVPQHASEEFIDALPAQHRFTNDGSLFDLETKIMDAFGSQELRLHQK